jgi:hypothetical protein
MTSDEAVFFCDFVSRVSSSDDLFSLPDSAAVY